jgi:glycosyltransferase involved in cell wall biosynthesis
VRRFDAVTGTAQAAAAAERWLGVPAARVVRTFNGVDFDRLDADAEVSPDELRAQHGVPPDAVLIGTAANLRRWKRIDWLIEAAGRLHSDNWRIWIIGDGEDRDRLQQLADRSDVRERIQFHGMQSAIGSWLRALDVFVLPSGPEESFGNAVIEAMACGVAPIVSRDCPAHLEHVADGRTGLVVGDPAQLARRLDELIASAPQRTRLGSAAKHFVRETYHIDAMVERFELLYDRLEATM